MRIAGVYRPPLAALGEELDQMVLRGVASATIRSMLRRMAALLGDAGEPAGQDAPDGGAAPEGARPELP